MTKRIHRIIEVTLVVFVFSLLIIIAADSPSMLAHLILQNNSEQKLQVLWFDIESHKIQKTELASNEEKTVTIYKGESTEVYLNKRFYILVFDDAYNIHHQTLMTGKEIKEQEVLLME